jgi:hypothetical protein
MPPWSTDLGYRCPMRMERRKAAIAAGLLAAALVAADPGWAARGHRGGARFAAAGATRGGFAFARPAPVAPATGFPHRHFHHGRAVIFIGSPFLFYSWPYGYYYMPPPYYYGPDYAPHTQLPDVYVEKFDGTPTPQTKGEIYCPSRSAHYPEVKDCPGGWQRIIREGEQAADSG